MVNCLRMIDSRCFVCFEKAEVVPGGKDGGTRVSLRCLLLYLKLGDLPNVTVGLCSGCEGIYGKFVELFQLRELLDMELAHLLRKLKIKMETEEAEKPSAEETNPEVKEDQKIVEETRKTILEKAQSKISNLKPRLYLNKLSSKNMEHLRKTLLCNSTESEPIIKTENVADGENADDDDIPVPIIEIPLDIGQIEVKLEGPELNHEMQNLHPENGDNSPGLKENETEILIEIEGPGKSKGDDDPLDLDFDPASASEKEEASDADSDYSPPTRNKGRKRNRKSAEVSGRDNSRTRPCPPGKNPFEILADGRFRCKVCPESEPKVFQTKRSWSIHFVHGHQGFKPVPFGTQTRYRSFNKVTGKFQCNLCKKEYVNKAGFSTHFRTDHRGIRYECDRCKKNFTARCTMTKHQMTCQGFQRPKPEPKYFCKPCGKGFSGLQWFREHQQAVHEGVRFECDVCKRSFSYQHVLRRHACNGTGAPNTKKVSKPKEWRFDCKFCGTKFQSYVRLRDHHRETFLKPRMSCSVCHIQMTHSCALKLHSEEGKCDGIPKEVDFERPEFYCDLCQKEFSTLTVLKGHRESIHLGFRVRCDRCNRSFTNKTNLQRHQKTCSGTGLKVRKNRKIREKDRNYNPKFKCDFGNCGRGYAHMEFLLKHKENDHPDRLLEPPPLPQTTGEQASAMEMFEELKSKHPFRRENGEVICNECGFSFSEKKGFYLHFRLVHRAALFQCDRCEKAFLLKKQLVAHYKQCG